MTAVLVLDCLLLILLILIQLPKKEAGAGMAFGGGATEALFGAGSGNALTKITKYVAGIFFVLSLGITLLWKLNLPSTSVLEEELRKKSKSVPASLPMPAAVPGVGTNAGGTNAAAPTLPAVATNSPPASTNK
jgi:preprotein translocase subunit SecG